MKKSIIAAAVMAVTFGTFAEELPQPITDPVGETTIYLETGYGIIASMAGMRPGVSETVGHVVLDPDGKTVYLRSAISSRDTGAYVRGTLSDDGMTITVQYPQLVQYMQDPENEDVYCGVYISVMQKYYTTVGTVDNATTYADYAPVPDEENRVVYTYNEDGSLSMTPFADDFERDDEGKLMLPERMVTLYVLDTDGEKYWLESGDLKQEFSNLPEGVERVVVPEDIEWEDGWALTDDYGTAQGVSLAFYGDDVYIKGLTDYDREAAVRGTMADGVVTIPPMQVIGIDDEFNIFIVTKSCRTKGEDQLLLTTTPIELAYDEETQTFTGQPKRGFLISDSFIDDQSFIAAFIAPVIRHQTPEQMNDTPRNPEFLSYEDMRDVYNSDQVQWIIPNRNVNGFVFDEERLYYNVYVNGEIYTFYPDEYIGIEQEMTNVPWGYNDWENLDIQAMGDWHVLYLYPEGIQTVGIQSFYEGSDGVTYRSDLITATVGNALNTLDADSPVIATEYYDLQGRRLINPAPGLLIELSRRADGTATARKLVVR